MGRGEGGKGGGGGGAPIVWRLIFPNSWQWHHRSGSTETNNIQHGWRFHAYTLFFSAPHAIAMHIFVQWNGQGLGWGFPKKSP